MRTIMRWGMSTQLINHEERTEAILEYVTESGGGVSGFGQQILCQWMYILCILCSCCLKGLRKKLLLHHDFRNSIALAWINPMYRDRRRQETATTNTTTNTTKYCSIISIKPKRKYGGSSTVLSITGAADESSFHSTSSKKSKQSSGSSIKATAITSNSLSPTGGLKMRLDANYDHLPDDNCKKNSRCGIHLWLGIETKKQVMYCNACNVNLYV